MRVMITGCGVGTPVPVLRNRHHPGENFPADSMKLVCGDGRAGNDLTDTTAARPCKGDSACSQNAEPATLNCRAGGTCQEKSRERARGVRAAALPARGRQDQDRHSGNALPAASSGHCLPPQPPEPGTADSSRRTAYWFFEIWRFAQHSLISSDN